MPVGVDFKGDRVRTTVKLKTPIEGADQQLTELSFRPLVAKDLRRLKLSEDYKLDLLLDLAGRLSGQPDHVIDQLAGSDLQEVIAVVSGFLATGLGTGSAS